MVNEMILPPRWLRGSRKVKVLAEYRRRALSVLTMADGVESEEEARELRKIARSYERLAALREKRLKAQHGEAKF